MDSRLLADHIAQRTQRFQPDLSPVEADDWRIPESAITDTTAFAEPRTTANLPAFLETFAGKKKTTTTTTKKKGGGLASAPSKFNGSPHSLVVCGAGLRAADVTRVVRKFQTKEAKVAKLFAKHIKLKEAREELKRTRVNFGVGTPQRIMDLIEDGALRTDELERIVVDASHIDQKKRGVLDMKELQVPLVKLLTSEGIKGRYGKGEGKIELLFY
jgi:protein CMS1